MKKLLFVALATFALMAGTMNANAQGSPLEPSPVGTKYLGVRFGAGPGIGANVTFDYGLIDSWWKGLFTVGGYVGTSFRSLDHYDEVNIPVALRATYRLNIIKDLEVYGGAMSGFYARSYSYDSGYDPGDDSDINFLAAGLVGANYYVTPSFGLTAEIVGAVDGSAPVFNVGVVFKF